jgi:hypothetical protein
MSDLDEKLTDIYMEIAEGFYFEGSDPETEHTEYAPETVEKIKQAFIDDGWINTKQLGGIRSTNVALPDGSRVDFMTGQEWYDRFAKELPDNNTDCAVDYVDGNDACDPVDHATRNGRFFMRQESLEAAKKAAGLTP